jgi:hypothetical protein
VPRLVGGALHRLLRALLRLCLGLLRALLRLLLRLLRALFRLCGAARRR